MYKRHSLRANRICTKSVNRPSANDAICLNDMIGRRVKVVRQAQGFTAEQLAAQLGDNFSVNTLRQLEVGARRWNADNLEAVAHALGVDPRALLPGPPEADTGAPRPIPNPAPAPALNPAERALLDAARAGDARGIAQAILELAPKPSGER